jgi:hypothetical protein
MNISWKSTGNQVKSEGTDSGGMNEKRAGNFFVKKIACPLLLL